MKTSVFAPRARPNFSRYGFGLECRGLRGLGGRILPERAVILSVGARLWSLAVGPITALLIVSRFDPLVQGYHLTFTSLLSLQAFAELGLSQVLVQFVSHEFSRLSIDECGRFRGEEAALARLRGVARFGRAWFTCAAAALFLVLVLVGKWYLDDPSGRGIGWLGPWVMLCATQSLLLALVPLWAVSEGCNQVEKVAAFRLGHAVISSTVLWFAILSGAGLWTAPLAGLAAVLWATGFLFWKCEDIRLLFDEPHCGMTSVDWRREIWPLQWRYAGSWLGGYLAFSMFTPLAFRIGGPVAAGRMGMTWALASALSAVSTTWVNVRVPRFGALASRRDYDSLDRLAVRTAGVSMGVALAGAIAIESGLLILVAIDHPVASRLLPPLDTGMFLVATVLVSLSAAQSAYLRAHKREPLMGVSLLAGLLILALSVGLGRRYGTTGMAAGYLGVVAVVMVGLVSLICARCRRVWHAEEPPFEVSAGADPFSE